MDTGASPVTLQAVYLDENGDFVWPEHQLPIANYSASKSRIGFTKPVNGQSVATFLEQKASDSSPKMYAQNFIISILGIHQPTPALTLQVVNPVKNQLQISANQAIHHVAVYTTYGVKIADVLPNSSSLWLDASTWQTGVYFLVCENASGQCSQMKLLKE